MARVKKTMRFLIEFPKPEKAAVKSIPCPFCDAKAGDPCVRRPWYGRGGAHQEVPISDPHQQRYAEYLNLEVVVGSVFRIKA